MPPNIDIDEVERLAIEQDSVSLLYKAIPQFVSNSIKISAMQSNLYNINFIISINRAIEEIINNNIAVIALKGLSLRKYYMPPEIRTMGDADILIHEEDVEKTLDILKQIGFKQVRKSGYHIELKNDKGFLIELHWKLINSDHFPKATEVIEKGLWDNLQNIMINNVNALELNKTYQLVYLLMHLAVHKKNHGFGIRQVMDLTLLIENEYKNINWKQVNEKLRYIGIKKFSDIIMLLSNKLFNLKLVDEMEISNSIEEKYMSVLIEYLFIGGVHGNLDPVHMLATRQTKLIISSNKLEDKYKYAKGHKILLPIALIHRTIHIIGNSDRTLKDLINYRTINRKKEKVQKKLNDKLFD